MPTSTLASEPQINQEGSSAKTVAKAIAAVLETGIRQTVLVRSYALKGNGSMVGKFATADAFFDYEIDRHNQITFNESEERVDSFLAGATAAGLEIRFDKANVCTRGKSCGGTCIEKGDACRVKMPARMEKQFDRVRAAVAQSAAPPALIDSPEKPLATKTLNPFTVKAVLGMVAAAAAVGAVGAIGVIGVDAVKVTTDLDKRNYRTSPDGLPDEETYRTYDSFEPGDLVRRAFDVRFGRYEHYAIYIGKDPETGVHMAVEAGEGMYEKDKIPVIQHVPLTLDQTSTETTDYAKVPESELKGGGERYSKQQIVDRAKAMVGKPFTYQGFVSNCESFARGVVEGEAYETQAKGKASDFSIATTAAMTDAYFNVSIDDAPAQPDDRTVLQVGNKRIKRTDYAAHAKKRMTAKEVVAYLDKLEKDELRRTAGTRRDSMDTPFSSFTSEARMAAIDPKTQGLRSPFEYEQVIQEMTTKFPGSATAIRVAMIQNYFMVLFSALALARQGQVMNTSRIDEAEAPAPTDAPLAPSKKKAINTALAAVLETGIQQTVFVRSYALDANGSVVGKFSTADESYDYEISANNEITFNESQERADSFLEGAIAAGLEIRFDQGNTCTKGKSCGGTCIEKGDECRVKMPPEMAKKFGMVRSAIQSESGQAAPAPAAAPDAAIKGKPSATAPAAKGKPAAKTTAPKASGQQEKPAKAEAETAVTKPERVAIDQSPWAQNLKIGAGVTAGVTAAALAASVMTIQRDLEEGGKDSGKYNFRQTETGAPDEETLKTYDSFKPGDLIRKSFEVPGYGRYEHYSVYLGKDPKTGEHMMVEPNRPTKDQSAIRVEINALSKEAGPTSSDYAKVPEEEMRGGGRAFSREETVKRALAMVDKPFVYEGFNSNCEAFSRGIVEGEAYTSQAEPLSEFTKAISGVVTDKAFRFAIDDGAGEDKDHRTILNLGGKRLSWSSYHADRDKAMSAQQMVEALKEAEQNASKKPSIRRDADEAEPPEDLLSAGWDAVIDPKTQGLRSPEDFGAVVEEMVKKFPGTALPMRREMYKKYMMVLFSAMAGGVSSEKKSSDSKDKKVRKDAVGDLLSTQKGSIRKAIAAVIAQGTREPVRVISFSLNNKEDIVGQFAIGSDVYEYLIDPNNKLEFQECDDFRSDSFKEGFISTVGVVRLDKQNQCAKGKPCGDACIPRGHRCRGVEIQGAKANAATGAVRNQLRLEAQKNSSGSASVKTQIESNHANQAVIDDYAADPGQLDKGTDADPIHRSAKEKNFNRIAGVATGASVAIVGAGVVRIAVDLEGSKTNISNTRIPPNGIPDATTFATYDTFKPGDLIRKTFTVPVLGSRDHYSVYVGKDPVTGEHMMIESTSTKKEYDVIPMIGLNPLTSNSGVNSSDYSKVPDDEMYLRPGTQKRSPEEVLERAYKTLGTPLTYTGFESNCESYARAVVEGESYSVQSDRVTPFTSAVSQFVLHNGQKLAFDKDATDTDPREKDTIARVGSYRLRWSDNARYAHEGMNSTQVADYLKQESAKARTSATATRRDSMGGLNAEFLLGEAFNATIDPLTKELRSPEDYGALVEEFAALYPALARGIRIEMYKNYFMMLGVKKSQDPTGEQPETRTDSLSQDEAQAQLILDLVLADRSDEFIVGAANCRTDAKEGAPPGYTWVTDPRAKGGRYLRKLVKSSGLKSKVAGKAGQIAKRLPSQVKEVAQNHGGTALKVAGAAAGAYALTGAVKGAAEGLAKGAATVVGEHVTRFVGEKVVDHISNEYNKKHGSAPALEPKTAPKAPTAERIEPKAEEKEEPKKAASKKTTRTDANEGAPPGFVWVKDSRVKGGRYLRKLKPGKLRGSDADDASPNNEAHLRLNRGFARERDRKKTFADKALIGLGAVGLTAAAVHKGVEIHKTVKVLQEMDKAEKEKEKAEKTASEQRAKDRPENSRQKNQDLDDALNEVKSYAEGRRSDRTDSVQGAPPGFTWVKDSRVKGGRYLRKLKSGKLEGKKAEADLEPGLSDPETEKHLRRLRKLKPGEMNEDDQSAYDEEMYLRQQRKELAAERNIPVKDLPPMGGRKTLTNIALGVGGVGLAALAVRKGVEIHETVKLMQELDEQDKAQKKKGGDRFDSKTGAPAGKIWVYDKRVKGGRYLRKLKPGENPDKDDKPTPKEAWKVRPDISPEKAKQSDRSAVGKALLAGGIGIAGTALAAKWWSDKTVTDAVATAYADSERMKKIEQEVIRRQSEAKTEEAVAQAKIETEQQLAEEVEGHKTRIAELETHTTSLEKGQAKAIATNKKELRKEFQSTHEARVAEIESEFEKKSKALESEQRTEIARRTGEAASVIERNALQTIEEQRQQSVRDAQKAIQADRDKQVAKTRVKGALISDPNQGIALAASARRGLDMAVIKPESLERRVTSAVGKLANERYVEGLSALSEPFIQRAKEIKDMPASTSPKKWQAMEHALIAQGNREKALGVAVDEVKAKYQDKHRRLLASYQAEATKRGHTPLLIKRADQAMTSLNREMKKEITESIARVSQEHPLDKAFLGRKPD